MKVVILAGGQQSTLSNFGEGIPKPMAEIGGKPLLWHIMKHFSKYDLTDFVVCGGYRVDMIKDYFTDFYIYESDITVDLEKNTVEIHKKRTENWKVTVVDTGLESSPMQRVFAVSNYLKDEEFIVTYGDCLSDVDAKAVINSHRQSGKLVSMVVAKPRGRKQLLTVDESNLLDFCRQETNSNNVAWVNADCFVMNRKVLEIQQFETNMEEQLFKVLSSLGQISTYKHDGYWTTIETRRDLHEAEILWDNGEAPWVNLLNS